MEIVSRTALGQVLHWLRQLLNGKNRSQAKKSARGLEAWSLHAQEQLAHHRAAARMRSHRPY
jgi:hypothetical protein